jgi:hypothetical protein
VQGRAILKLDKMKNFKFRDDDLSLLNEEECSQVKGGGCTRAGDTIMKKCFMGVDYTVVLCQTFEVGCKSGFIVCKNTEMGCKYGFTIAPQD